MEELYVIPPYDVVRLHLEKDTIFEYGIYIKKKKKLNRFRCQRTNERA